MESAARVLTIWCSIEPVVALTNEGAITMDLTRSASILAVSLLATALSTAHAAVIAVGPDAFPAGSTLITFAGLADGTEVNGVSVAGVLFNYSLGNGAVLIDGGPGVTNNIDPPNVVSVRQQHWDADTRARRIV